MKALRKIAPHALCVLCMMFAVFLILDEYNPLMNFIDNAVSRVLLGVLCAVGVGNALLLWRGSDAKK